MNKDSEYYYYGIIRKVVDGDTLHVTLDLGLHVSIDVTLRLYGIDTPELRTEEGVDAKVAVYRWLSAHGVKVEGPPDPSAEGLAEYGTGPWQVVVKTIKDRTGKYGRYLAEIYSATSLAGHPNRVSPQLNSWLVSNGYAKVYK